MRTRDIDLNINSDNSVLLPGNVHYDFERNHALLIGTNYRRSGSSRDHSPSPLECAEKDAKTVGQHLIDHLEFPEKNVDYRLGSHACRNEILGRIDRYGDELDDDDNLVVYYAGHADNNRRKGGSGFLLPYDPEGLYNYASRISFRELLGEFLGGINARHILVMLDCCYAGKALSAQRSSQDAVPQTFKSPSRYILTSGADHPVPDRERDTHHSPFANRILEYLGKRENADPVFCTKELEGYLKRSLSSCRAGYFGSPDLCCGDYWFVRSREYRRKMLEREREAQAQRQAECERKRLEDKFRTMCSTLENVKLETFGYYAGVIENSTDWDQPELKELRTIIDDWENGRIPERYMERVLNPRYFEDFKPPVTGGKPADDPGGDKPKAPVPPIQPKWKKFGQKEEAGVVLDAFRISIEPVSYDQFMKFKNSPWYNCPEDDSNEVQSIWKSLWTENGVIWHRTGETGNMKHSDCTGYISGVSWFEAVAFCNWLSWRENQNVVFYERLDGCPQQWTGFRLPLLFEIETACCEDAMRVVPKAPWEWTADVYRKDPYLWCKTAEQGAFAASNVFSEDKRTQFNTYGSAPQRRREILSNVVDGLPFKRIHQALNKRPNYVSFDSQQTSFVVTRKTNNGGFFAF